MFEEVGTEVGKIAVTVSAETASANVKRAATGESVYCQFLVNDAWTAQELFFEGTKYGQICDNVFNLHARPTKIRLRIGSSGVWGFWRLVVDGKELVCHPQGPDGPADKDGKYWLAGVGAAQSNDNIRLEHEYDLKYAADEEFVVYAIKSPNKTGRHRVKTVKRSDPYKLVSFYYTIDGSYPDMEECNKKRKIKSAHSKTQRWDLSKNNKPVIFHPQRMTRLRDIKAFAHSPGYISSHIQSATLLQYTDQVGDDSMRNTIYSVLQSTTTPKIEISMDDEGAEAVNELSWLPEQGNQSADLDSVAFDCIGGHGNWKQNQQQANPLMQPSFIVSIRAVMNPQDRSQIMHLTLNCQLKPNSTIYYNLGEPHTCPDVTPGTGTMYEGSIPAVLPPDENGIRRPLQGVSASKSIAKLVVKAIAVDGESVSSQSTRVSPYKAN